MPRPSRSRTARRRSGRRSRGCRSRPAGRRATSERVPIFRLSASRITSRARPRTSSFVEASAGSVVVMPSSSESGVGADQRPVDVDALEQGMGQRPDQGATPLPELPADDDEPRTPPGELDRGRQAVRDHGQALPAAEQPGGGEHRAAAVEVDGVVGRQQLDGAGRDPLLLRGGFDRLDVEVGLARIARRARRRRRARGGPCPPPPARRGRAARWPARRRAPCSAPRAGPRAATRRSSGCAAGGAGRDRGRSRRAVLRSQSSTSLQHSCTIVAQSVTRRHLCRRPGGRACGRCAAPPGPTGPGVLRRIQSDCRRRPISRCTPGAPDARSTKETAHGSTQEPAGDPRRRRGDW